MTEYLAILKRRNQLQQELNMADAAMEYILTRDLIGRYTSGGSCVNCRNCRLLAQGWGSGGDGRNSGHGNGGDGRNSGYGNGGCGRNPSAEGK
jgi:hypothetical protein